MDAQDLSISRRSFLSGLVGSLVGTGVILSASERALAGSPATGDWSHPEGNAAHTARLDDGVGPTGNITKAWEDSLSRGLNNDSVAVVDGTVYTAGDVLKAMDAADGTERWEFSVPHPDADPGEEGGASDVQDPTVMDGTVYVPVRFGVWDGNGAQYTALIAVDAKTGTKRWRIDAPGGGLGRPFSPVSAVDGTLLTTAYDIDGSNENENKQYVYAIDPADGTVRWRRPSTDWAPPVADGRVYLAEKSGIKARDVATGEIVWTALPRVTDPHAAMVSDGTLFVGEDNDPGVTLIALDAATGNEHWRTAYSGSSLNPSGGAADDTRVYVQIREVDADVIALDRTDGSEHWRATIPQPPKEQHALVPTRGIARVGDLLYVGGAALRPADGATVWTYAQPDGWVTDHSLRAVAGGRVYLTGGKLTVLSGTTDQSPQTLTVTRSQGTSPTSTTSTDTTPTDTTSTDTTPTDTTPPDTSRTDTTPTDRMASTPGASSPTAATTHDSNQDAPAEQPTTANGPGFGVLSALAGIGVGAWRCLTNE